MRVLVVDDNVDVAESLRFVLEVFGHEVSVAYTGAEALEVARAARPEAMIVDIGIPDMDGYEIARQVRKEPYLNDVPLIAITGDGTPENRRAALAAGFDHHLVKPVDPDDIEELFKSLG